MGILQRPSWWQHAGAALLQRIRLGGAGRIPALTPMPKKALFLALGAADQHQRLR